MYVESVALANIKGFAGPRAVDLQLPPGGGWIVLAGRNGSGKTTLLRALGLCLAGPTAARTLNPDFSGWLTVPSDEQTGVARAGLRYVASDRLAGRVSDAPGSGGQELGLSWTRTTPAGARSSHARSILQELQPEMHADPGQLGERGPWAQNPRGWFCAGYGPFRRLLGGSGEAQRLMLGPRQVARMATLFHEDASLAEGVSWLVNLHLRQLEGRAGTQALMDTVLAVLSDGLLPDDYEIRTVNSEGMWVARRSGRRTAPFPLKEMSDGYRTMAALVLDLIRQIRAAFGTVRNRKLDGGGIALTAPGVVLIDEIETHLHLTWQRQVGPWMRRHFPNIQFIVTTHSPYVCQSADPDGLIRLPGPTELRPPAVVEQDLYQRVVFGSGDDAAISQLFGLETPYSDRAQDERRRLVALESKLYAEGLSAKEGAEYERLSRILVSSLETRAAEVIASLGGDR